MPRTDQRGQTTYWTSQDRFRNKIECVLMTELPVATGKILPIKGSSDMPRNPKASNQFIDYTSFITGYTALARSGPLLRDSKSP